jgi:hypothetical protein
MEVPDVLADPFTVKDCAPQMLEGHVKDGLNAIGQVTPLSIFR